MLSAFEKQRNCVHFTRGHGRRQRGRVRPRIFIYGTYKKEEGLIVLLSVLFFPLSPHAPLKIFLPTPLPGDTEKKPWSHSTALRATYRFNTSIALYIHQAKFRHYKSKYSNVSLCLAI